MSDQDQPRDQQEIALEGGAYEIIRARLDTHGKALRQRLDQLNEARRKAFGSIETVLLGSDRITTANNCTPRDMVPVNGKHFIFGYNVQVGLRSGIKLEDVFAVYAFHDHAFHEADLTLLNDPRFNEDFANLYRYYKHALFVKFAMIGPHLFMVFRVGKAVNDIKTFRWLMKDHQLTYVDNRGDADFRFPDQHDFLWQRVQRDAQRSGEHPHVCIEDRVFVETVGGDLTIKVEDNTRDGAGIYSEPVDDPDQSLDDADIHYSLAGGLILLKIRPYQEKQYRYFVFNEKLQRVTRIDAIEDACIFLPEEHGIIFSNGFYLQNGEHKIFDIDLTDMTFDLRIASPNGEDYLYSFYQRELGHYVLLTYNLIEQRVSSPIMCDGFSVFPDGVLAYFRREDEPGKHHSLQFWQTPFVGQDHAVEGQSESPLTKIGNKDIVRAMAECREVLTMVEREEVYASLYVDLVKKTSDIADTYFWLGKPEAANPRQVLEAIREAAGSAVDEFEKVRRVRRDNHARVQEAAAQTEALLNRIRRARFESIEEFVAMLAELRVLSGELVSVGELRYVDGPRVEALEQAVRDQREQLSTACVTFLLQPESLDPYRLRLIQRAEAVASIAKLSEAKKVAEELESSGKELELLIEVVSNLRIDDPTQTTAIIDQISDIYADLNRIKAKLDNRKKELARVEGIAEFNAQVKLLEQSLINYLDVCDAPGKCDLYLNKLMVQVEELEGRFADFDEFVIQLTEKRDAIYNAFEARRLELVGARNKRASALATAADRILKGIANRVAKFEEINQINGYFAGDLMIEKIRDIVRQLFELEDSVKGDSIQSRMKTIREDAIRRLHDRQDLFEEGASVIRLGEHRFSVNTQPLALTVVAREDGRYLHLTGTDFFERITDKDFLATREVWDRELLSESRTVYRGEYLAYQMLLDLRARGELAGTAASEQEALVEQARAFMGPRYREGYAKGVHDHDAAILLRALAEMHGSIGLLIYPSEARACAAVFWHAFCPPERKTVLEKTFRGLGTLLELFPDPDKSEVYVAELAKLLRAFVEVTELFAPVWVKDAAAYLVHQLMAGGPFCISREAAELYDGFDRHLRDHQFLEKFRDAVAELKDEPVNRFFMLRDWMGAYIKAKGGLHEDYRDEAAALIFTGQFQRSAVLQASVVGDLEGLRGDHPILQDGRYQLHYNAFMQKLESFQAEEVPKFERYQALEKQLSERFRRELKLEEFKPRILSSFVRNRLIDRVFLPLIGDNLAKQMGAAGEKKRTDLMGMLLLISPPGYGKTTLMEYVAERLGLVFVKVNGPAIGHRVTALDPAEAPNSAARDELQKLNFAFEMGDNIMIYLDDIQHCNPEFLQKFISLCDAQRKIEGVFKGVSRTYDLRRKKVAVVMAGNPYTESGEKFQIPDMLANRADTYNLGDIIGNTEADFRLSYVENCLTSNPALNKLRSRSQEDVYGLIKIAETGSREGVELAGSYTAEELEEIVGVLRKLLRVRDLILSVNLEYIRSAAQADAYRTEPAFKLQGSYRNMNKIAEKVVPLMNDEELETLLFAHYDNEAQTLTSGAEANLLKLRELMGVLTDEETARWEEIKTAFRKNQSLHAAGGDRMGQAILQLAGLGQGLEAIQSALAEGSRSLAQNQTGPDLEAIRGIVKEATQNLPNLDLEAVRGIVTEATQNLALNQQTTGIDEVTLKALEEVARGLKGNSGSQGREERQALLILLEKQFGLMETWLKTMHKNATKQDKRLGAMERALARTLKSYDWVIKSLDEMNAQEAPGEPDVRR